MFRTAAVAALWSVAFAGGVVPFRPALEPTRVIRFTPAPLTAQPPIAVDCHERSRVATHRDDAFRCAAPARVFDPCFVSTTAGTLLCEPDPRSGKGTIARASSPPARSTSTSGGLLAWFFELPDGTTCKALAEPRETAGHAEYYSCTFGSAGEADAVLGDLDDSKLEWTIQKVLINKKTEPQTIKSLMIVPVRTVWQ